MLPFFTALSGSAWENEIMQRQRDGELVPIGEVVADLDGPVKAIREASPQARTTSPRPTR